MFHPTRRTTTATDAGRKVHRRPSAALIVASLALFTALSGGAYAATTIGSLQIKNNAVRSIDIQNGTIKTADMSLVARLALKGKAGPTGPAGAAGAAGAAGLKGDQGAQGAPGVSGLERVTDTTANDSNSPKSITVTCPAGKKVVGTGFDINGAVTGVSPNAIKSVAIDQVTVPSHLGYATFSGYEQDATALNWTLTGYALCAYVG
jgi:hypothetical protein